MLNDLTKKAKVKGYEKPPIRPNGQPRTQLATEKKYEPKKSTKTKKS